MITREEVIHIAKLARIELTEQEIEKFQKDLSGVLDYFEILKTAPTEGIEPMMHAIVTENIEREDVSHAGNLEKVAALIEMTPQKENGFLKVQEVFKHEA